MAQSATSIGNTTRVTRRGPAWALWLTRVGVWSSIALLTLEYGIRVNLRERAWINIGESMVLTLFVTEYLFSMLLSSQRWESIRSRLVESLVFVGLVLVLCLEASVGGEFWGTCSVIAVRTYLIVRLITYAIAGSEMLLNRKMKTVWLAVASFMVLILGGAVLMMLPEMRSETAAPWTFSEALFTSTSGACVTGLSVRDITADLSFRGQVLLLTLIQLGGLGPIIIAMTLSYMSRKSMDVRQMQALREMLGTDNSNDLGRFLGFVLTCTVVIEMIGAAVLFPATSPDLPTGERVWRAVFHSTAAFNNAGFVYGPKYALDAAVCLPIMGLVILGGLGFPVLRELISLRPSSFLAVRRLYARWGKKITETPPRLSLQAKIVLFMTAMLIVVGSLGIYLCEYGNLTQYSETGRLLVSSFHAVMARTAGYNTVDLLTFSRATLMILFVLMIIGAGPMSTGGGIRVVSVAVIFQTFRAMARNEERVTAYKRTIPRAAIQGAMAVAAAYLIMLLVISWTLTLTQKDLKYGPALFESVSALSTAGFSIGVTAQVDTVGRLILCVAMFVGRLGPLALLLAMVSRRPSADFAYPEESVTV